LSFFVVELLTGARLHAAQYALIGAAQVLFYLLLLSIAEHLGFETAYVIGATATVGLTTAYAVSAFGSRRHAGILLAVLSVQYGALYSLLQVEDYALLLGSVLLFAVLAVVMYLTRNLNWYRLASLSGEA
jgi:inner membrane protein